MARINSQAGNEFNRGIRAYYYGIAALGWFLNPWIFMAASLFTTFFIYRCDFHSKSLLTLRDQFPPDFRQVNLSEEEFIVKPAKK